MTDSRTPEDMVTLVYLSTDMVLCHETGVVMVRQTTSIEPTSRGEHEVVTEGPLECEARCRMLLLKRFSAKEMPLVRAVEYFPWE